MDRTWLRDHRFLVLLSTLGLAVVVQSLNQRLGGIAIVTDVLVTLVILAVFLVVFQRTRERLITLATASVAIAILGARYVLPRAYEAPLAVAHDALVVVFLGWAVVEILRGLFSAGAVNGDDVLGAVCGYVLAGAAWAKVYGLASFLVPGSFDISGELQNTLVEWHGRSTLFMYFSFVTLTTLGYGDVTPTRSPATTLVLMEAVFGQFYVAVVVAQIVSMRLAQAVRRNRTDGSG